MDYVSGNFGWELVKDYILGLTNFPYLKIPDLALDFFQLSLGAMSEKWRRFTFSTQSYPCETFKLAGVDHDKFVSMYSDLKQRRKESPCCIDPEFTGILLEYIVSFENDIDTDGLPVREKICHIQQLLDHIMAFAPISSDLVECLHGYCQRLVRQSGPGARPTDSVAQQRVLWGSITAAYNKMYQFMWDRFGDKSFFRRLPRFGGLSRTGNQYTREVNQGGLGECKQLSKNSKSLSTPKIESLLAHGQQLRKPRRLCGF